MRGGPPARLLFWGAMMWIYGISTLILFPFVIYVTYLSLSEGTSSGPKGALCFITALCYGQFVQSVLNQMGKGTGTSNACLSSLTKGRVLPVPFNTSTDSEESSRN